MLNNYLEFARTQAQEITTKINLNKLLNLIKDKFNNDNLTIEDSPNKIELNGRPTALKRCFENI